MTYRPLCPNCGDKTAVRPGRRSRRPPQIHCPVCGFKDVLGSPDLPVKAFSILGGGHPKGHNNTSFAAVEMVVQFTDLPRCINELANERWPSGRRRCLKMPVPCGVEDPDKCPFGNGKRVVSGSRVASFTPAPMTKSREAAALVAASSSSRCAGGLKLKGVK